MMTRDTSHSHPHPTGHSPAAPFPADRSSSEREPAGGPEQVGYPLVSLFLLVAVCGILLGMVAPLSHYLREGSISGEDLAVSAVLAGLVLSVVGMMVSLHVHRRLSGIVLGGSVGAILGIIAGPLCFVPREGFTHLLVVSLGGAVTLLAVGAVTRLTTPQRSSGRSGPDADQDAEYDADHGS